MNAVMARERPRTSLGSRKRRGVLIVDDQAAIRQVLRIALERQGIAIHEAATGEAALEIYRRQPASIGVVLLDVRLPGLSGPETWQALRDLDAQVPCCFMSGEPGAFTEADLLRLGARHFFPKPFALNHLTQVVRGLLQG